MQVESNALKENCKPSSKNKPKESYVYETGDISLDYLLANNMKLGVVKDLRIRMDMVHKLREQKSLLQQQLNDLKIL
jgi:hypothetical protein